MSESLRGHEFCSRQKSDDQEFGRCVMKAMVLDRVGSLTENPAPLRMTELPDPVPMPGELLLRVLVCGVCHTELDEIEGRLTPPTFPVVLGHEIVARIAEIGDDVDPLRYPLGQRVGVGWIHSSDGSEFENLSNRFRATGFDVNGGYAELMTVPQEYAIPIPDRLDDLEAAPLMCAGAIGYRALRLSRIRDGGVLGLMGFGGSAHLVLPMAKHLYPSVQVYVLDRNERVREFALERGADWAGGIDDEPPSPVDSIIDTTPAWKPVVASLKKLAPGGRLVINAIRKEDRDKEALMDLSYHDDLWMEREIKSVANLTHRDLSEFLPLAGDIPLRAKVTAFPLRDANEALRDLRGGGMRGANVLQVGR